MASEHFANQEKMFQKVVDKMEQIALKTTNIHFPLYWTNGFFCGIFFSFILYIALRRCYWKTQKIRTDLPYTTNLN